MNIKLLNDSFIHDFNIIIYIPGLEYKRFSGLRSLCAIFISCKCFTATQISYIICAASIKKKEKDCIRSSKKHVLNLY